jgi:hypothetical protein
MRNSTAWRLFAALFVVVSVSGLFWVYVATGESLRATVASPVYWLFVLFATVASYVGYRRGQRIARR